MSTPCHALVFRDVRAPLSMRAAGEAVTADLAFFLKTEDREFLVSALLRAGELDCALADSNGYTSGKITALLARALVDESTSAHFARIAHACLQESPYRGECSSSRPEGFAFYGIHPLDYHDAMFESAFQCGEDFVVIGIRSIGVTLGNVACEALRKRFPEKRVQLLTERPCGDPYDRRCEFNPIDKQIIQQGLGAQFVIVDEGPGLSGSSFLSVGEALISLGVKHGQITFFCSRQVDPQQLVTRDGAQRWNRFKTVVAQRNHFAPNTSAIQQRAGEWRNTNANETAWPGLWTSMLPPTYRSADGRDIFEYQGLGHYGDAVRRRINALAAAGFTSPNIRAADGFSGSQSVAGRRLSKGDRSPDVLDRMAEYLACRLQTCTVPADSVSIESLEEMARFNAQQAGAELSTDFHLSLRHPVISDSQMMPHAWLQSEDGGPLLKLESGTHGDNHFYPGPVDIAWDLAGAIIEWEMADSHRERFIAHYARLTNDDARPRLHEYLTAYAAFRNGYCRMAASAIAHDPAEQARLLRDAERYRCVLDGLYLTVPMAAVAV